MNRIDIIVQGSQWLSYANRVLDKLAVMLKKSSDVDEVGGQFA